MGKLFFITGASGSGKTTVLKAFESNPGVNYRILFFDSIGVPSPDEMNEQYGSGENWQKVMTGKWVEKIQNDFLSHENVILDGQMKLSFITDACDKYHISDYKIILIDCNDDVRKVRLAERGQPELANDDMMNWAQYLRDSTINNPKTVILDNTKLTLDQTLSKLKLLLK